MGFMKWGFVLSYYYLLRSEVEEQDYKNTMKEVISMGGDTDTNACIVGGMLGALLGFKKLDEDMVKSVFFCDCTEEGR